MAQTAVTPIVAHTLACGLSDGIISNRTALHIVAQIIFGHTIAAFAESMATQSPVMDFAIDK